MAIYTPVKVDNLIIKRKPLTEAEKEMMKNNKPVEQYESILDKIYRDMNQLKNEIKEMKENYDLELLIVNNRCKMLEEEVKNLKDIWTIDKTKTNGWITDLDDNDYKLDDYLKEIVIELGRLARQQGIYDDFDKKHPFKRNVLAGLPKFHP
jgi:DNA repair exonuclease SbcCD ATPase subunit